LEVRPNLTSCLVEIYKGFEKFIKGKKFPMHISICQFLLFLLAKIGKTGMIAEVQTVVLTPRSTKLTFFRDCCGKVNVEKLKRWDYFQLYPPMVMSYAGSSLKTV
jgi:hypothetical protein